MITTIEDFIKAMPKELEDRCDPTFLQNLLCCLATLSINNVKNGELRVAPVVDTMDQLMNVILAAVPDATFHDDNGEIRIQTGLLCTPQGGLCEIGE